ncbi:MAG TPA: tRNA pseudouridine(13) synthase TruD, partial [Candidatus Methanomethylicus sp.]|nr:tRNA pseudouridine(13) synthase TruD [Candidatus Methanomethylicus sp.]
MPLFRTRSRLESDLGMEYYASGRRGIGGALRRRPGDFIVEEIIREGQPVNLETERIERGGGRYTLAVLSKTSKDLLQTVS